MVIGLCGGEKDEMVVIHNADTFECGAAAVPARRHRTDKMNTYGKAPEEALACFGAFALSGQHDISPEVCFCMSPLWHICCPKCTPSVSTFSLPLHDDAARFLYSVRCRRSGISCPPV